jgi:hypothetical protein
MKRVELHVSGMGGEYFAGYLTPEQKKAVLEDDYRACDDIVTEKQEYDVTTVDNIFHLYTANSLDLTIELVSEDEEDNEDEEEIILAEEIRTFNIHTFAPTPQDAVNRGFASSPEEVAEKQLACMAVARKEEGDWFDLEIELEEDEEFNPNRLVFGTFSLQEILNEDEIVAKAYYGDIDSEAFGTYQAQLSEFFATGKYTLTDTLEEIASEPYPPAGVQELELNTEIAGEAMPLNCEMRVMDVANAEILKEDNYG